MHPWNRFEVERVWRPKRLCCLIVGENPGSVESTYFYDAPKNYAKDPVAVRRCLLRGLRSQKLLATATLEGFRDAGFLFDHAIRCPLPKEIVDEERNAAVRYASIRVQNPAHLLVSLSQAPIVWVMGHLASNAVANLCREFPKKRRRISQAPFPGEVAPSSRFFVPQYFTWRNEEDTAGICAAFMQFARTRSVF